MQTVLFVPGCFSLPCRLEKNVVSLKQNVHHRRRRRPIRNCSSRPPEDSSSNFDEASLNVLQKRLTQLRQKEVQRDRQIAANWRSCRYSKHICAAVTPDFVRKLCLQGDLLALGTSTGSVVLSHLRSSLQLTCRNAHIGQVTAIDYSHSIVASAGSADHVVMLWRCAKYEHDAFWEGRLLSGAPIDGDLHPPDMTLEKHGDVISAVKMDVPGRRIYTACVDGMIRVFNLQNGERLVTIRVGEPILSMKLTEKGYLLVGCASGRVLAYQAERGLYLLSMICHAANTTAIDFWEDTETMVTGDSAGNLSLWSFKDSSFIGSLPKHDAAVISVQMDSSKIISASRDGSVAVSVLDSLKRLYSIHGFTKYIGAVTFDNVRLIADGTNDIIFCLSFDADVADS